MLRRFLQKPVSRLHRYTVQELQDEIARLQSLAPLRAGSTNAQRLQECQRILSQRTTASQRASS
jgi:hypothetical protein